MKKFLLASIVASQILATSALAQTAGDWGNESSGRFSLTGHVGYVYNLISGENSAIGTGIKNGGLGYGVSLGFTHNSGLGLSVNYLGLANKWSDAGVEYNNPYHVMTVAYSYRLSFGAKKEWGIKLGVGLGASFTNPSGGTAKTAAGATAGSNSKVAGGASYKSVVSALVTGCEFSANSGVNPARFYTDGIQGTVTDSGASGFLAALSCQGTAPPGIATVGSPASAITDSLIASQFTVGTGAVIAANKLETGFATTAATAVSYGVWRRLFKDAPIMTGNMVTSTHGKLFAGSNFNNFETRIDYIARCTANACEGQAGSAAGAALAATAVDTAAGTAVDVATMQLCTDQGAGYAYAIGGACTLEATSPAGDGKVKAYPDFVIVPEIAMEYDNGYFHIDVNARYIQQLFNPTYTSAKTGPLAIYVGGGLGVNF